MIHFWGKDHSASIEEREKFIHFCTELRTGSHVYLQTCNRVEVYSGDGAAAFETVRHLFRVTSGLESCMVGERHIQGQVKRAYLKAIEEAHISSGLHKLFQAALRTGKKVRSLTGISTGAVTHSRAVVELLKSECGCLADQRVMIVGVHKTNENILGILKSLGCESVVIVNRDNEKSKAAAEQYGFCFEEFGNRYQVLSRTDVLITATSSEQPIFTADKFSSHGDLLAVDIAVPRDIDPLVSKRPGIRLFNVADVESRIDQNLESRRAELAKAGRIIEGEVASFTKVCRTEGAKC